MLGVLGLLQSILSFWLLLASQEASNIYLTDDVSLFPDIKNASDESGLNGSYNTCLLVSNIQMGVKYICCTLSEWVEKQGPAF